MLIKYTGYESITATVSNVFCPSAAAYWYTGSLSPKGFTYIVNGILDDGDNSTSDDFSYNTELKSGFTVKFKTAYTLYSNNYKPTYVWSYISLLPKFDNTLYGKLTKSTTYVEVRERAKAIDLKANNVLVSPLTKTIQLSYPNSKTLSYTLYPTNCYHKNVVFKQKYGYNTIVNNILTPIKAGLDTLYCYSREYNNNDVLLGIYETRCLRGSQTKPTISSTELTKAYPGIATASATINGFYDKEGGATVYWENGNTLDTVGTKQTRCYITGTQNYKASAWSDYVTLTVTKGSQTQPTINLPGSRLDAYYPDEAYVHEEIFGFWDREGGATVYWSNGNRLSSPGTIKTRCYITATANYNASVWSDYVTLTVYDIPTQPPTTTTTTNPPINPPTTTTKPSQDETTSTPELSTTPTPTPTPSVDEETLTRGDGSNNGHNYVDLGLPSGTKWATCNVGADLATSDGLLFQFGRTDGYVYGDTNNTFTTAEENNELTGYSYINPTTSRTEYDVAQNLSLSDDMARVNMGGDWIMPTKEDLQELYNNTTRKVITINDKQGMLFTSKLNSKSIFVVFAGYWDCTLDKYCDIDSNGFLWSSEVSPYGTDSAGCLCFDSNGRCEIYNLARAIGYSVRGVIKDYSNIKTTTAPTATPTATPTGTPTSTPTPTPTGTPTPTPTLSPLDVDEEILTVGDGSNNGHNYVDLGLPSGTKWATCNVGADLATSDGLLFQFGRTDGYAYGDINNKFITGSAINPTTSGTKYDVGQILSLDDDMARANMGGNWIMPTRKDLQELCDNTTSQVVTINGKQGMLFTSKLNGKSIFVVFAGYWHCIKGQFYNRCSDGYLRSSEVDSISAGATWYLDFDSDGRCGDGNGARAHGYSVRGVLKV